jgi:hypothetical protein
MTAGTAMKDWEFLIQKEGDRTWLPIETQTVEILEGRYRIVVRTHRPEEEIEVRIGYVSTDETPPKRRVQQRTRRSNAQGLMPIVAFTRFRSGIWEIRCGLPTPGQTDWQARFELQVQPQDSGESFEWEVVDDEPLPPTSLTNPLISAEKFAALKAPEQAAPGQAIPDQPTAQETADPSQGPVETWSPAPRIASNSPSDINKLRQLAEQMSQTVVDSMLEFTSGLEASQPEGSQPEASQPEASQPEASSAASPFAAPLEPRIAPIPETDDLSPEPDSDLNLSLNDPALELPLSLDLSLRLDQDTIVLGQAIPQSLNGQVQGPADEVGVLPAGSLLCLELRDPATAQCVALQHYSLDLQPLPAAFTFTIELPPACNSQLLLGSLQLQHQGHAGPATVLATQSFTVVAPVSALLNAVDPTLMSTSEDLDGPEQSLSQSTAEAIVSERLGYNKRGPEIDTALLKFLDPVPPEEADRLAPQYKNTRNRVLPPKLSLKSDSPAVSVGLDLPSFAARSIRVPTPPPFQEEGAEIGTDRDISPTDEVFLEAENDPDRLDEAYLEPASPEEAPPGKAPLAGAPLEEAPLESIEWGEERAPEAIASISTTLPDPQVDDDAGFFRPDTDLDDQAPTQAGELRSLNLEARFLDRLNAFAAEDAAFVRRETALANANWSETTLDEDPEEPESNTIDHPFTDSSTDFPTWPGMPMEVVAEDEPAAPASLSWLQPKIETIGIPDDMPIPEPELAIARLELVAGQRLEVELRVAAEPTRLCAKIWMTDCQTRTLLMEPMLVTDFIHGFDEVLETCVDMNVPLGCMELQVEAIAIEPISQRESRKVVLRRSVLPPDFLEAEDDSLL